MDSAKRLARRVEYSNAGTMEFLVDQDMNPYFIEMNPRIQVEHTVTEMVTGIDIVSSQILVAEGYPLNSRNIHIYSQNEVKCNGFSIQARVTTENPANHFVPDSGKIDLYRASAGNGIRLDGGNVYSGAVMSPHYDNLLVKIISHDRTFEGAIKKLTRCLKEFRIHGVKNNMSFLINLLNHNTFKEGKCFTTFIAETSELFDFHSSLDRTSKILEFLANKMVNVHTGPKPYLEDRKVPEINTSAPVYGTRDDFLRLGPKEWTQKIYRNKKLYITDTTMRDAQQSLLATRMRTKELAGAARATNLYLKDSFSIEAWGGATYDTAYRFLNESPWLRLDLLRERMPNVMIQALIRGSNVVGYSTYPDNVIRKFIKVSSDHGVDIYRIFDSMNWIENMKVPIEEALKSGKVVEGAICYTGDVLNPRESKYTIDYYVNLANKLAAEGCHTIAIKDMAALLKPYAAKKLITALKSELKIPVHLHTHDTTGNGIATYLMAAEAGVDIVDCAIGSMSSLTSQPSMNALIEALKGTERDTGIDTAGLDVLDQYYSHERKVYKVFESGIDAPINDTYLSEIPGGQYSNLDTQLKSMGSANDTKEIRRVYREADELLGHIIKVTPTSKVVGDLAIFMLKNNLTKDNIFTEGKDLSYPVSVVEYFKGMLGQPEGGFPEKLQQIVLKGQEPLTVRPGTILPDVDFDAIDALYPKVYEDYCEHFEAYNDVSRLESHVYFYGLRPNEETTLHLVEGRDTMIKFIRASEPDLQGYRTMEFEVNGFYREVRILDKHYEVRADRRLKADPRNPGHLGASLPGVAGSIRIKEGDHVEKNAPLLTIEAMKMETTLTSKVTGIVDKIYVKNGDEVNQDDLLITFIVDKEDMPEESHPELPKMDPSLLDKDDFNTVS